MSRAVWFDGPRSAVIREEADRRPDAGEVQVRAHYSLISPGSEMHVYRGDGGLPDGLIPTMSGSFDFPVKFAYQTVGEVVEVGDGVDLAPGDHVFCSHPHQDLFTLPAGLARTIDPAVDLQRAVFASMFQVGLVCNLDAPIHSGEVVVVTGLGLIGSFCAFLARKSAGSLIVVDSSESRRARADWIGADAIVPPDGVADAVDAVSGGRGADLWIEASASGNALQSAIDHTGQDGRVVVPAWYGMNPVTLRLSPEFHLRRLKIISSWVGLVGLGFQPRWDPFRLTTAAIRFLADVDLDRIITHRIPFAEAPRAYEIIDSGVEDALGVVLVHDQAAHA